MWKYTPERDVKAEFVKALIRSNKSLAYALKDEMELPTEKGWRAATSTPTARAAATTRS